MITREIGFILQSLDLSQAEVARQLRVSVQHIHNVCARRYSPSFDLAVKIEDLLKATWESRRGETVPPEVAEIVFRLLWPPPPSFDPKKRAHKGVSSHRERKPSLPEASAPAEEAAACQTETRAESVQSLVMPSRVPELGVACDFGIAQSVARVWPQMRSRRERDAIIEQCWNQPWAMRWSAVPMKNGAAPRREKIVRTLNDLAGRKQRQRGKDAETQAHREAIFDLIAPPYAQKRKSGAHSKGAYDEHAFGSAKSALQAVLDTLPIQRALTQAVGEIPTFDYCYDLIRERLGVDAYAEARKEHLQMTIGFRPAYDGHVLLADATGIPIRVAGPWAEKRPGQKGNKNGFQKHWLHLAVDVASAYTWIHPTFSDNEADGWPPFLQWLLLEQLRYAPEYLSVDEVSGVFTWLRDPNGEQINLPPEVLLLLAAGVHPYIHQPGRPTGGAHGEVAVKGAKDTWNRITIRRALEKELAGQGLKKSRHFESQAEFQQTIDELRIAVNERHLARAGDIRRHLWHDPESAAKRNARALVPNASAIWRDVVARTKLARCSGRYIHARVGSQKISAELCTEVDFKPEATTALIFPTGLRVGDDPDRRRIILIESRAGQPLYHAAEATVTQADRRGFDTRQPIFGTGFVARPDTAQDEVQKLRSAKSAKHVANVNALREATTDSAVTGIERFK